jgi:hypothetical protein
MSKGPQRRARAGCAVLLAVATVVAGCASAAPTQPVSATTAPPSTAVVGPASATTAPPSTVVVGPASATTAPPSTAPVGPGSATTLHDCAAVPAGIVGATLGEPTAGPRQFNLGQGVIQCVYGTDISQPTVLRFYNDANASVFARLESIARTGPNQHVTNVTFEDEAFFITGTGKGITVNELVARSASLIILVISSASLQAEETLGYQIFARV